MGRIVVTQRGLNAGDGGGRRRGRDGGGGEIHVRVRNVVRWHMRGIQGKDRAEEFLNNTPCINT